MQEILNQRNEKKGRWRKDFAVFPRNISSQVLVGLVCYTVCILPSFPRASEPIPYNILRMICFLTLILWLFPVLAFEKKHFGPKLGDIHGENILPFIVALPIPNQAELNQFLEDLYNPSHSSYKKYLKPQEFYSKFSPQDQHINVVRTFLENSNLQIESISENNFLIYVRGKVKHINKAFNCTMGHYLHSDLGYVYKSPDVSPKHNKQILTVYGLDNSTLIRRHSKVDIIKESSSPFINRESTAGAIFFPLVPAEIKNMYNIPTDLKGAGQTFALVEYDNFLDSDIIDYAKFFNLSSPKFERKISNATHEECCQNTCFVCGTLSPPLVPGNNSAEVTLDIEIVLAIAPEANVLVYIGANTDTVTVLNAIAQDNLATVVSTSWGFSEAEIDVAFATLENQVFQQMAAQGQSFFAAAGDSGAFSDPLSPLTPVISDPSQPTVTVVGGTSVSLDASGSIQSETTWNNGISPVTGLFVGGGGGISLIWSLPSYQNGLASFSNQGSSTSRMVPDVSLNADPNTGYVILLNGTFYEVGGTSVSTPIWGAFITLTNELITKQGLPVAGSINNFIYELGKGNLYRQVLNDINDDSNNGNYFAVTGYDLATGWGSLNGKNLLLTFNGTIIPTGNNISLSIIIPVVVVAVLLILPFFLILFLRCRASHRNPMTAGGVVLSAPNPAFATATPITAIPVATIPQNVQSDIKV